jgi:hypothetical protein
MSATGPFGGSSVEVRRIGCIHHLPARILEKCHNLSLSEMHLSRAVVAGGNSTFQLIQHQFCHDVEGWGPLSAIGYDFTPCFVDVPLAIVSVFGILAGAATIRWLLVKASRQPTQKDWHYFAKLVSNVLLPCRVCFNLFQFNFIYQA